MLNNALNFMLTDGNHFKHIEFNGLEQSILDSMEPWSDIPMFTIITGPNGSGKSQLLYHINKLNQSSSQKIIFPKDGDSLFSLDDFNKKITRLMPTNSFKEIAIKSPGFEKIKESIIEYIK